MDFNTIRIKLLEALEPVADEQGFELVDISLSGSTKNPTVTVFLDDGADNALDNLCKANEWVEALVEELALFDGSYTLEVSSPGINRPLRKLSDFEKFAGEKAEIKINAPRGTRSVFKGTLAGVEDSHILIETDNGTEKVESALVLKAHLRVEIDFKSLKGTKNNA